MIPDHAETAALSARQRRQNPVGAVRYTLSAETRILYARAWARFARFCAENGRAALPALPGTVEAFMRQPARGRGGMARSLAAIDHAHRQRGLGPPERDAELRAALRAARKAAPHRWRHAVPMPAQLNRLAQSCPGDLAGSAIARCCCSPPPDSAGRHWSDCRPSSCVFRSTA